MKKDERLEALSDNVRRGIPIDMNDAFKVIEYQDRLKVYRKSLPWYKRIFAK